MCSSDLAQQDQRDERREDQEGGCNPGQTDAATAHGGDFIIACKKPQRQERRHENRQGCDLERNGRSLQGKISQDVDHVGIELKEAPDFFKKIDHQIDRHEPGKAHQEDFGVFAKDVAEKNGHRDYS